MLAKGAWKQSNQAGMNACRLGPWVKRVVYSVHYDVMCRGS